MDMALNHSQIEAQYEARVNLPGIVIPDSAIYHESMLQLY